MRGAELMGCRRHTHNTDTVPRGSPPQAEGPPPNPDKPPPSPKFAVLVKAAIIYCSVMNLSDYET